MVLIDTFEDILGPNFTPEMRKAWELVYDKTAGTMIADAYPESEIGF